MHVHPSCVHRSQLAAACAQGHRARHNGLFGIAWTKKQRLEKAAGKEVGERARYFDCKARRVSKGKCTYPEDGCKGLNNCSKHWKAWQKWRGKKGEAAIRVAERAEKLGRIDPEGEAFLLADMAASMNEDPIAMLDRPGGEGLVDDYLTDEGPNWIMIGGVATVGLVGLAGLVALFR